MIKINELRIGNYILCKVIRGSNKSIEPYPLNINMLAYCAEMGTDEIDAEPIPLTPEILEKCGFEEKQKNWHERKDFSPTIEKFNSNKDWCMDFGEYVSHKLEYLHQLQNLYFALTGEELEINL